MNTQELPEIGSRIWRLVCPWGWHTVVAHESATVFKTEEGNTMRVDDGSEEVIWCREESALDPTKPNVERLRKSES